MSYTPLDPADLAANKPARASDALLIHTNLEDHEARLLTSFRVFGPLGGSRTVSLPMAAGVQSAIDWLDVELPGTDDVPAGVVFRARVECRTEDAGTSVTPKIRNITDGTDAALGAACTATDADYSGADQVQTLTINRAATAKTYRLQATVENGDVPTYLIGYLEVVQP
jgi:hypothetical protein